MSITATYTLIKHPDDARLYTMPFSQEMDEDETIEASSPAPAVTTVIENSSAESDLTIGTVSIDEQDITIVISGGTSGNTYRVQVQIDTSESQTLERHGLLFVF